MLDLMKKKTVRKLARRKTKSKQTKRKRAPLSARRKKSIQSFRAPVQSQAIHNELPFSYNQTKLTLLVRDPYWAYSYWDFSEKSWKWIVSKRQQEPNLRSVLRIHNLKQNGNFDLDVDLEAKNWYVHLNLPGATFEFELGLLDPRGQFHSIVRSNRIQTPRDRPSDVIAPAWDTSQFDEIYRLSGGGHTRHGSELSSRVKKP